MQTIMVAGGNLFQIAAARLGDATQWIAACANQTPAQQTAAAATVASGLVCLADATGKVVATASTSDPKAVNAAIAAGNALMTDAACQSAMASGAAVPTPPAVAAKATN